MTPMELVQAKLLFPPLTSILKETKRRLRSLKTLTATKKEEKNLRPTALAASKMKMKMKRRRRMRKKKQGAKNRENRDWLRMVANWRACSDDWRVRK